MTSSPGDHRSRSASRSTSRSSNLQGSQPPVSMPDPNSPAALLGSTAPSAGLRMSALQESTGLSVRSGSPHVAMLGGASVAASVASSHVSPAVHVVAAPVGYSSSSSVSSSSMPSQLSGSQYAVAPLEMEHVDNSRMQRLNANIDSFGIAMPENPLAMAQTFYNAAHVVTDSAQTAYMRSELMSYVQLYIPPDIAYATVSCLGELGAIHFANLNEHLNAFQLAHVDEIRRVDDSLRRLRDLTAECGKLNIKLPEVETTETHYQLSRRLPVTEVHSYLTDYETRMKNVNKSISSFAQSHAEFVEMRHVIMQVSMFFTAANSTSQSRRVNGRAGAFEGTPITPMGDNFSLLGGAHDVEAADTFSTCLFNDNSNLNFLAGVIPRSKTRVFEEVTRRAVRNNLLFHAYEMAEKLLDPKSEEWIEKDIFLILINGQTVMRKVQAVIKVMGATIYPVHTHREQREKDLTSIESRICEVSRYLQNTISSKKNDLIGWSSNFYTWRKQLEREKLVFQTMNMFKKSSTHCTLIAEGWCPNESITVVQQVLLEAKDAARSMVPSILNVIPSTKIPPTFIKQTALLSPFQMIIDSYGVPSYREINPAVFAIITFPFLFAVMFGDFGHGIIVTLASVLFCLKGHTLQGVREEGEMLASLYNARYMLVLMSVFSTFSGLIYNDAFSRMMSIFSTKWKVETVGHELVATVDPASSTYAIGIDPVWDGTENRLLFINNYKMKMSLILGVIQMTFGSLLSLFNMIHFKKYRDIICDFIPQILFNSCIFGYLILMIIIKWCIPWNQISDKPPGLLNTLIFMFLSPFGDKKDELYKNQGTVQSTLVVIALICVPWMLCLKPYLIWKEKKTKYQRLSGNDILLGVDGSTSLSPETPGVNMHRLSGNPLGSETGHKMNDFGSSEFLNANSNVIGSGGSSSYYGEKKSDFQGADPAHGLSADSFGQHRENDEDHGGADHHDDGMLDIVLHQVIHTIEFCLSCVSNTASYLRLWALSLAHAQLSEVLWDMIMDLATFSAGNPVIFAILTSVVFFPVWFMGTLTVMIGMEGMSAFLHALRLHWVEFNGRFYSGSGYSFQPFSFKEIN